MSKSVAYCAVITRNYAANCLATFESLRAVQRGGEYYVGVIDEAQHPPCTHFAANNVQTVENFSQVVRDFHGLSRYYDAFELVNALRADLVRHLLFDCGYEKVFYLDSDLLFTAGLDQALAALEKKSVFLVPHADAPYPQDGARPQELALLQWGLFNSGFLGFARTEASHEMLRLLSQRARQYSFFEPPYLHGGQEVLDLLPLWFPEQVHISRDEGYNLGFWNLHQRSATPPVFYHFSGFDPASPALLTPFAARVSFHTHPHLRRFTETYRLLLASFIEPHRYAYGFDVIDGVTMQKWNRRFYYRENVLLAQTPEWFHSLVKSNGWNAVFNDFEYREKRADL